METEGWLLLASNSSNEESYIVASCKLSSSFDYLHYILKMSSLLAFSLARMLACFSTVNLFAFKTDKKKRAYFITFSSDSVQKPGTRWLTATIAKGTFIVKTNAV